jgi:hypothetical protein
MPMSQLACQLTCWLMFLWFSPLAHIQWVKATNHPTGMPMPMVYTIHHWHANGVKPVKTKTSVSIGMLYPLIYIYIYKVSGPHGIWNDGYRLDLRKMFCQVLTFALEDVLFLLWVSLTYDNKLGHSKKVILYLGFSSLSLLWIVHYFENIKNKRNSHSTQSVGSLCVLLCCYSQFSDWLGSEPHGSVYWIVCTQKEWFFIWDSILSVTMDSE